MRPEHGKINLMNHGLSREDCEEPWKQEADEEEIERAREEAKERERLRQLRPKPKPLKEKIEKYFPFDNIRPNQIEALGWIEEFLLSDKKFLILELPVGSGKSPIAMTAAICKGSAHITTANKVLQDQYLRDFKHIIKDLRGKPNYQNCYDDYIEKNKKPPQSGRRLCSPDPFSKKKKDETRLGPPCEYHMAYDAAKKGPISSYNSSAFFSYSQVWGKSGGNVVRSVLVIDEGHTLVSQLSNFVEFSISLSQAQSYSKSLQTLPGFTDIPSTQNFLFNMWKDIMDRPDQKLDKLPEEVKIIPVPSHFTEKKEIEAFENFFRKLHNLLLILNRKNIEFIVDNELDIRVNKVVRTTLRPVVVKELAHEYCFQFAEKVIILSATILDVHTYCDMLGIDLGDMMYRAQGSLFPVVNRPIYTRCIGNSLNMRNLDAELPNLCSKISTILGHYKDYKGIIHGTTYRICTYIYENLKDPRILFPKSASEQKDILSKHYESPEPTVLLSPSMQEGVDLKDDSSRFQIIVKVPFPNLGDKIIKKRMELYDGYYDMQTCLSMVQSYGRSTRTEQDWSHTFILDGQFWRIVDKNKGILPRWFLEAIQN